MKKLVREPEFGAEGADFVLEEVAKRLDELETETDVFASFRSKPE